MHFDTRPVRCSCEREEKHNDFRFGSFIGRFPSDDVASMAVKGLRLPNRDHGKPYRQPGYTKATIKSRISSNRDAFFPLCTLVHGAQVGVV